MTTHRAPIENSDLNARMRRLILDFDGHTCRLAPFGEYCKFGNVRENFIFANIVKRHICDPQSSRLRHDLHVSVNDGVNLRYFARVLFSRNFAYAKFRENKTLAKISESTVPA